MGGLRRTVWAALGLGVVLGSLWGGGSATSSTSQPLPRKSARRPRAPAGPMPEVVLTGRTQESRAVEARLAAFVRAVRRRDGARAASFLSRETAPSVRAAVTRQEWPWRTAPQDLGPLFAVPALWLQTIALRPDRARVRIGPQKVNRHSLEAAGYYDIGMVREGRWWQVRLPEERR
jgi:hypothetical protein